MNDKGTLLGNKGMLLRNKRHLLQDLTWFSEKVPVQRLFERFCWSRVCTHADWISPRRRGALVQPRPAVRGAMVFEDNPVPRNYPLIKAEDNPAVAELSSRKRRGYFHEAGLSSHKLS